MATASGTPGAVRHAARTCTASKWPSTRTAKKTLAESRRRVDCGGEGGETVDRVDDHRIGVAEAGDHRERCGRVVGHLVHLAVRRDAEHVTVEHHHLAVEILERTETEVAVLAHDTDRHRTLVHALHQRARGRHLVERVVLDPEVLGERPLDQVVTRRAAAARQLVERGRARGRRRVHAARASGQRSGRRMRKSPNPGNRAPAAPV